MTIFTVVWLEQALAELAGYWLETEARDEATRGVAEIDRQLRHDPEGKGVEVSEGLRRLIVPPFRVFYAVRADDRIVEVSSIKPLR